MSSEVSRQSPQMEGKWEQDENGAHQSTPHVGKIVCFYLGKSQLSHSPYEKKKSFMGGARTAVRKL